MIENRERRVLAQCCKGVSCGLKSIKIYKDSFFSTARGPPEHSPLHQRQAVVFLLDFFTILLSKRFLHFNLVGMPTILRIGPYRFYFYSHEPNEPPHIHVDREGFTAKFWLAKVNLACHYGFRQNELNELQQLVMKHQKQFLEQWYEYFGS